MNYVQVVCLKRDERKVMWSGLQCSRSWPMFGTRFTGIDTEIRRLHLCLLVCWFALRHKFHVQFLTPELYVCSDTSEFFFHWYSIYTPPLSFTNQPSLSVTSNFLLLKQSILNFYSHFLLHFHYFCNKSSDFKS